MRLVHLGLLAPLVLAACKTEDPGGGEAAPGPGTDRPDLHCPGDAGCATATGPLHVGVGSVSITPTCFESFEDLDLNAEYDEGEAFLDCGCDRLCEGDAGYPGADEGEGDGEFQAVWMAGYQNNRPAQGVHDDLYARAIVFDQGDTRVALVSIDVVGWFFQEVEATRVALAAAGSDVDLLLVSATHVHEGPDTVGLWGPTETVSGVDVDYNAFVRAQTVAAVQQAEAGLTEVGEYRLGKVDVSDYHSRGSYNLLRDARDPKIIDLDLGAAAFMDAAGNTIASICHFGLHPEGMADENGLLTSDFPWRLREGVETGVVWDSYSRDGIGGTNMFLNGTVGGMMTGLGVTVEDPDGQEYSGYTFDKTAVFGQNMAEMCLDAIEGGEVVTDAALSATAWELRLPVENYGFQAMFLSGILARETHDWDPAERISAENMPHVITEVDIIDVGPLQMLSVPGELLPELAVGGFDGSQIGSPDQELVDADNLNPPNLVDAPTGPFVKARMGGEHNWIVGLGNDELGYIIPPYNFQLHDTQPWFEEAEGDHYEETNSLGISTGPLLDAHIDKMLEWRAERR